jgi:hypothetical protein
VAEGAAETACRSEAFNARMLRFAAPGKGEALPCVVLGTEAAEREARRGKR